MKIFLCTPYNCTTETPGGISVWAQNIVQYFDQSQDGIQVEICSCNRSKYINENTGLIKRLYFGISDYTRIINNVKKRLKVGDIGVLHINTTASISSLKDIVLCKMAKKHGVKSVLHYHFGRIPQLINANNREWKLVRQAMQLADKVIVMDAQSYSALQTTDFSNKVVNIPNPYSPNLLDRIEERKDMIDRVPHRILFMSRVFRKKGIYELVEACKHIEGIELRIVGPYEDVDRYDLEKIAGHEPWISFVGPVPHNMVLDELLACDIYVLPSYTEGFPNAILEAMLCRAPIIVTPVGAIPEMLDFNGSPCGISIRTQNVDDIAKAINSLIHDESLKNKLTERAYHRVNDRYSISVVGQLLSDCWLSLK